MSTITAPTIPARPAWATDTSEPAHEGENGNWSVEYSTFVGDDEGIELVEIVEEQPGTGWIVRCSIEVLVSGYSLVTPDEARDLGGRLTRVAQVLEGHTRPVGTIVAPA